MAADSCGSNGAGSGAFVEASQEAMVELNVRVPYYVRRDLKVYAAENGLTLTQLLIATFQWAGILSTSSAGPAPLSAREK